MAGELIGGTIQSLGEMDYRYPFRANKSISGRNTIITDILTTIIIHGCTAHITRDCGGEWVFIIVTITIIIPTVDVSPSSLKISIMPGHMPGQ